jgi:hypothetical protein
MREISQLIYMISLSQAQVSPTVHNREVFYVNLCTHSKALYLSLMASLTLGTVYHHGKFIFLSLVMINHTLILFHS